MRGLYLILSVDPAASRDEIEVAYLRKIQQVPKTGVRGWLVRSLNMTEPIEYARKVLVSPEMRRRYDLYPEEFEGFPAFCAGY